MAAKTGPKAPRKYTPEVIDDYADKLIQFVHRQLSQKRPIFLSRFAFETGLDSSYFSHWASVNNSHFNPKFAQALRTAKEAQESDLAEGGLLSDYDAGFAFRALKNVSGWRDESQVKVDGMNQVFNIITPSGYTPKNPKNRLVNVEALESSSENADSV